MVRITLRQLSVFDAVARTGSVSKAADEVHLTQAAVSMSLRDLEGHLRLPLFERFNGRLVLNEHGKRIHTKVKSALREAGEIESLAGVDRLEGRLRIGATHSIGGYVLPEIVSTFLKDNEGARIVINTMTSGEIMDRVDDMSLDFGLITSACNRPTLTVSSWTTAAMAIFCAPDHPLAAKAVVEIGDLTNERWHLEEVQSSERILFSSNMLKFNNSLNVVFESENLEAIKRAVMQGNGLGCLASCAIAEECKQGRLVALDVQALGLSYKASVVARAKLYQSELQRRFIEHLTTCGGNWGTAAAVA